MAATPDEEARRVAAVLETAYSSLWERAGTPDGHWGYAEVCRVRPGRVVHVVGASGMAEYLRDLYGSGAVPGWTLQPMPQSRTPLHLFSSQFLERPGSRRIVNLLNRTGFVYAEEVRACPDEALLDLRLVGASTVAVVRQIFGPYLGTGPAEASRLAERRRHTEVVASAATLARYPEFLRQLARSLMPIEAVDAICSALNAEPLPPVDPAVRVLLFTAGESELLALYEATHRPLAASAE